MVSRRSSALGTVVLFLAALLWLTPYAWMTLTSLKTLPEILAAPTYPLPKSFDTSAYREVFQTLPLGHYFWNSFFMATAIALLQIALALPAGYALAKLKWRGRAATFGLVLACLLIPPQVTFVPVFILFGKVGLLNSMTALIVPFAVSAFGTFLIRQALLSVPNEIIEAARLDGASELRIIYGFMAPILKPTLVAVFLFSFIYHYSDYFWPLTMTMDDSARTLPVGIALLREQGTGARWHVLMAGNVILSAPILLLFAGAQRHIVRAVAQR
jgi:sn-glycerol 3-phosphate transport system permease protein